MVREVNGYEIDLDKYEEITDQRLIKQLEYTHFNQNTKQYDFDYRASVSLKVGDKWYTPIREFMGIA
jgi:hypothetical protein